jgi:hypothetical protein
LPQTGERFYKISGDRNAFGELKYFNGEASRTGGKLPGKDAARGGYQRILCARRAV